LLSGRRAGAVAPVTWSASDEYNLNVVDCNVSVTVAHRSSISVSGGLGVPPAAGGKREIDRSSFYCSYRNKIYLMCMVFRGLPLCDFVSVGFVVT
jgi:hypothetical protein